ncbi:MAG: hypothetical protein R3263_07395 [Myxococcota bacterium]|nr:hypothetical protein [Myxococcota bacterium]
MPSRCRVHWLPDAKPTDRGIVYRRGEERFLLAWTRVQRAFAAQVGEDEEAPSVVLDLAVVTRGAECVICRTVAAPGEDAMRLARAVEVGVPAEAVHDSVRAVAQAGAAPRRVPDLETWTEVVLEAVRFVVEEPRSRAM